MIETSGICFHRKPLLGAQSQHVSATSAPSLHSRSAAKPSHSAMGEARLFGLGAQRKGARFPGAAQVSENAPQNHLSSVKGDISRDLLAGLYLSLAVCTTLMPNSSALAQSFCVGGSAPMTAERINH